MVHATGSSVVPRADRYNRTKLATQNPANNPLLTVVRDSLIR
jgi:hypothetical protein